MKRKILASLLCALALGFTACDDDDDDAIISTNPGQAIAGKSFDGKFQVVNTKTSDTTYVDGSLSFSASESEYACLVSVVCANPAIDQSYVANVVQTSNGFSFSNYPSEIDSNNLPIGNTGFFGWLNNDGSASIYFERFTGQGRKAVTSKFTFSNVDWNNK